MIIRHLPGPWVYKKEGGEITIGNLSTQEEQPHDSVVCVIGDDTLEAEANAKLIAAAPEMFNALIALAGAEAWVSDPQVKAIWQTHVYPALQKASD